MIFKGTINNNNVLICKQVDGFQIAASDMETILVVISQILVRVILICNDEPMTILNGVDYF